MNDIIVDRVGMGILVDRLTEFIDEADTLRRGMPEAPDGGTATSLIAFIASAGAEAGGLAVDTTHLLSAVTLDAMDDMNATDEQVAAELRELEQEVEQ